MRSNPNDAIAYMKGLADSGARGVKGWCLRTCRQAWGLPSDEESAIKEWESIPAQHRHSDPMKAPVGAPHFWKIGKFGHVAIQAEYEGFVWSTDAPNSDRVGLVHLDWFKANWRAEYLGWSRQFQNQLLPLAGEAPQPPKKKPGRPKKEVTNG